MGQPANILHFNFFSQSAVYLLSQNALPGPDDAPGTARECRPGRHFRIAHAGDVHHPSGFRAVRGASARRPRPHAGRARARGLRPDPGLPAGTFRLAFRPLGAQARHLSRAGDLRARQFHGRPGAGHHHGDPGPGGTGRGRDFRRGDRAHRRSHPRRSAHQGDGDYRHHHRRHVRAFDGGRSGAGSCDGRARHFRADRYSGAGGDHGGAFRHSRSVAEPRRQIACGSGGAGRQGAAGSRSCCGSTTAYLRCMRC